MKNLILSLFVTIAVLGNSMHVNSQTVYHDASEFLLLGKITTETETRYERLPADLKDKVARPAIWTLGKNTSGLAILFSSNSTSISAKWEVLNDVKMNHMTETGIKGLDLYAWENNKWEFVKSALPKGKITEQTIISNMLSIEREYLLFLPLYDGLTDLSIGVDSAAMIGQPHTNHINRESPIVVYGTSITQGGCATRPGMSYTNIMARWMNREFINLGFSGNGQLDYEIAEVMAKRKDAGMFVLDFIPNVDETKVKEKTQHFVGIIRKENPHTPILFVESIIFPHSRFDTNMAKILAIKNAALRVEFEALKNAGDKNVYYLNSDNLMNEDGEGTVDGIHLTDMGFQHFAFALMKEMKSILVY